VPSAAKEAEDLKAERQTRRREKRRKEKRGKMQTGVRSQMAGHPI
jgi:hypothetical protein